MHLPPVLIKLIERGRTSLMTHHMVRRPFSVDCAVSARYLLHICKYSARTGQIAIRHSWIAVYTCLGLPARSVSLV